MKERRASERHDFHYYMPVTDDSTNRTLGHMADVSSNGFKLDSSQELPVGRDFRLRLDLERDVSNKPFISFVARSRWCAPDRFAPAVYNVGFEIVNMTSTDIGIYRQMVQKYAS